jgi:hypothetical protein
MSLPAQSPQGDQTAQPRKAAIFHSLRTNFSSGGFAPVPITQTSTLQPVAKQEPELPEIKVDESQNQLIDKVFNNTPGEVVAEVSAEDRLPPLPVSPVPSTPPVPAPDKQEEFSSEFLSGLLGNETPTSFAAAIPTAVAQAAADSLNPLQPTGGTIKESAPIATTTEALQLDTTPGVQYVETEPQAEISPEVESFLTQVENHQQQLPQEIVIADKQLGDLSVQPMAQPVIVLPLTKEVEKEGAHKPSTFSVRWLIEWSHKMMKIFAGKIVYRTASPAQ